MSKILDPAEVKNLEHIVALDHEVLSGEAWSLKLWCSFLVKRDCILIAGKNAFILFALAADEAELIKVAVAKNHQAQGLGRQIIKEGLAALQKKAVARVFLEVRASNNIAIGLYQSLGFTKEGVRKKYYQRPIEDAQVWVKRLKET